jgi:hypothetical protein
VTAGLLAHATIEDIEGPLGIGCGGRGLAQQRAKAEEVLLAGAALGEVRGAPLGDELVRRHAAVGQEEAAKASGIVHGHGISPARRAAQSSGESQRQGGARESFIVTAREGLPTPWPGAQDTWYLETNLYNVAIEFVSTCAQI